MATKRVETIFGDCALAVHPDDKRYNDLVGKEVLIPLIDRKIPIICDESIGSSFGEGIVRITPAHVPNDYTIARRNKLPIIKVINAQGKMNEYAGKYTGLDRYECRKIITQYLQQNGLLVKKETVRGGIGYCYRCMTEIEPYLSKQWFFRVEELIEPAIELVKKNKLKFNDKKWEDSYLAWLNTLKNRSVSRQSWWEGACIAVILSFSNKIDWCISRQIWWGHKIPVWYCKSCKSENISAKKPEKCFVCRDDDLKQDDNVLDMWFSCALWPLSTLKWPKYSDQLKYYYPNSICVTGHDVIYFWIIPTILINLALMKTAPYSEVFVHGLVCDINGKKMSKSLGNTIEPHELINKYGADALRYALISQANTKGEDIKLSVEAVEKGYYFIKEIWRFSNSWKEILKNCVLNLYSEDNKIERFSNTNNEMNEVIASLKEIYQQVMIAIDNYDYAEVLKCLERFYYSKQFNDFSNYIKEKYIWLLLNSR